MSEWGTEGLFWDDLRRDLPDPEYAKHHRRSLRRLKWRAFWWGFFHPFGDPRR